MRGKLNAFLIAMVIMPSVVLCSTAEFNSGSAQGNENVIAIEIIRGEPTIVTGETGHFAAESQGTNQPVEDKTYWGRGFKTKYPLGAKQVDFHDRGLIYDFQFMQGSGHESRGFVEITTMPKMDDDPAYNKVESKRVKQIMVKESLPIEFGGLVATGQHLRATYKAESVYGRRIIVEDGAQTISIAGYAAFLNTDELNKQMLQIVTELDLRGLGDRSGSDQTIASGRKEIVVDASGEGDYTSLQKAILYADDGDTVLIKAGSYLIPDTIYIDKSINLVGDGRDSTHIELYGSFDGIRILGNAEKVSFKKLSFSHFSSARKSAHLKLLFIQTAAVVAIDSCSFTNSECTGIFTDHAEAVLRVNNCYFTGHPHKAISVWNGTATIEKSIFDQNSKLAIAGFNVRELKIDSNHIVDSEFGMALGKGGRYIVRNNIVQFSAQSGVSIDSGSIALVEGNQVEDSKATGILISDGSVVRVEKNSLYNNRVGVFVQGSSVARIGNNVIKDHIESGVVTFSDSYSYLYDNEVNNCGTICVETARFSRGDMVGNTISGAGHSGVSIVDGSIEYIDKTRVASNQVNGVYVGNDSTAYISSAVIVDNKERSVLVENQSRAFLCDTQVHDQGENNNYSQDSGYFRQDSDSAYLLLKHEGGWRFDHPVDVEDVSRKILMLSDGEKVKDVNHAFYSIQLNNCDLDKLECSYDERTLMLLDSIFRVKSESTYERKRRSYQSLIHYYKGTYQQEKLKRAYHIKKKY